MLKNDCFFFFILRSVYARLQASICLKNKVKQKIATKKILFPRPITQYHYFIPKVLFWREILAVITGIFARAASSNHFETIIISSLISRARAGFLLAHEQYLTPPQKKLPNLQN